jgi:ribonuclease D
MRNELQDLVGEIHVDVDDLDKAAYEQAQSSPLLGWDTETSGLDWRTDVLHTCQVHIPNHGTHVVRLLEQGARPARLISLLENSSVVKVFHHAMFDLRFMLANWQCRVDSVRCTKVASKLAFPGRKEHRLQDLVDEMLGLKISKQLQRSDWSLEQLSQEQLYYAALDAMLPVALLPGLLGRLKLTLRADLSERCFAFLPTQVDLDLLGCSRVFEY